MEIYFKKENSWTLDAKGELLITIMSSLAQEESRSISENTIWDKRKMFADGRASIGFKDFLTHKLVVNNGEVPQYYVEGHHESIVTADQFDQVRAEILRRKGMQKYSGVGLFSSIIKCGEFGS